MNIEAEAAVDRGPRQQRVVDAPIFPTPVAHRRPKQVNGLQAVSCPVEFVNRVDPPSPHYSANGAMRRRDR